MIQPFWVARHMLGARTEWLDVHIEVHTIHYTDIRKTPTVVGSDINGRLKKGFRTRCRLVRLAAIVEAAAVAGLALRGVVSDVITAPGSRPEHRGQRTCAYGVLPLLRYVYRQDSPGPDHPGSLSRRNGERRVTSPKGRARTREHRHFGL